MEGVGAIVFNRPLAGWPAHRSAPKGSVYRQWKDNSSEIKVHHKIVINKLVIG